MWTKRYLLLLQNFRSFCFIWNGWNCIHQVRHAAANCVAFREGFSVFPIPTVVVTNILTQGVGSWCSKGVVQGNKSNSGIICGIFDDFPRPFWNVETVRFKRYFLIVQFQDVKASSKDKQIVFNFISLCSHDTFNVFPVSVVDWLPLWNRVYIIVGRKLPRDEEKISIWCQVPSSQVSLVNVFLSFFLVVENFFKSLKLIWFCKRFWRIDVWRNFRRFEVRWSRAAFHCVFYSFSLKNVLGVDRWTSFLIVTNINQSNETSTVAKLKPNVDKTSVTAAFLIKVYRISIYLQMTLVELLHRASLMVCAENISI